MLALGERKVEKQHCSRAMFCAIWKRSRVSKHKAKTMSSQDPTVAQMSAGVFPDIDPVTVISTANLGG
jgi:hypothetical protein